MRLEPCCVRFEVCGRDRAVAVGEEVARLLLCTQGLQLRHQRREHSVLGAGGAWDDEVALTPHVLDHRLEGKPLLHVRKGRLMRLEIVFFEGHCQRRLRQPRLRAHLLITIVLRRLTSHHR